MKVINHILNTTKPTFSYEILPPLKGANIDQVFDIVKQIKPFNPSWINVTSHASTLIQKPNDNGCIDNKIIKKRPGTISVCGIIQNKFCIDAVAHVLCLGFSKEETENALIELNYLGVENVLALRGDNLNYDKRLSDTYSVNTHANQLTKQIVNMRHGLFLDNTEYTPLNFCVGVAAHPEKHFEATSLDADILYLKQKVDAGADYIITQMFFDNNKFYKFVNQCRLVGINVPIIPGIKIIKTYKHLESLPKIFNITLPTDLVTEIEKNPENVATVGKAWAITQLRDLVKNGINNIHFFLMNDVETVIQIIEKF
jgi:methylenetetrahydrofolate reductase (NADPH)